MFCPAAVSHRVLSWLLDLTCSWAREHAGGKHLADVLNTHSAISVVRWPPPPEQGEEEAGRNPSLEDSRTPAQRHVFALLAAAAAAKGFTATSPARCAVGVLYERGAGPPAAAAAASTMLEESTVVPIVLRREAVQVGCSSSLLALSVTLRREL